MKHLVFAVIWISHLIYIFIGALIFEKIERQEEIDRKKRAKEKFILDHIDFLGEIRCLFLNRYEVVCVR